MIQNFCHKRNRSSTIALRGNCVPCVFPSQTKHKLLQRAFARFVGLFSACSWLRAPVHRESSAPPGLPRPTERSSPRPSCLTNAYAFFQQRAHPLLFLASELFQAEFLASESISFTLMLKETSKKLVAETVSLLARSPMEEVLRSASWGRL